MAFPAPGAVAPDRKVVFRAFAGNPNAGENLGIAGGIHNGDAGIGAPSGLVFHDDRLAAAALHDGRHGKGIVKNRNAGLFQQFLQRKGIGGTIVAGLVAFPVLPPVGNIIMEGILCGKQEQFLGDAADDLTAIAVAQGKIDHDVTRSTEAAEHGHLLKKQYRFSFAGSGQCGGTPRNAAADNDHVVGIDGRNFQHLRIDVLIFHGFAHLSFWRFQDFQALGPKQRNTVKGALLSAVREKLSLAAGTKNCIPGRMSCVPASETIRPLPPKM